MLAKGLDQRVGGRILTVEMRSPLQHFPADLGRGQGAQFVWRGRSLPVGREAVIENRHDMLQAIDTISDGILRGIFSQVSGNGQSGAVAGFDYRAANRALR